MGHRRLPRAEDDLAPDRPVAAPFAYREWGDPAAPALVFWPGLQLPAHATLNEHGPGLAAVTGRRVLAVSPPGWETPPLPADQYLPSALVRSLVAWLDGLGLERITFVGFSWGASIGCHFGASAPDRLDAIVLLDAGYTDFQDRPGFAEVDLATVTAQTVEQARELRWSSWTDCFAYFRPRVREWSPAYERRLRDGLREDGGLIVPTVSPEVIAAAAYGVIAERPSQTLARLGSARLPTLLVVASETVATAHGRRALERFRSAVPSAEVVELDSGHDLLADAPGETLDAVGTFLRRLS